MPKKGRARRFREARELKQGFDDGLFNEGKGTLADAEEGRTHHDKFEDEEQVRGPCWDEEDPLRQEQK